MTARGVLEPFRIEIFQNCALCWGIKIHPLLDAICTIYGLCIVLKPPTNKYIKASNMLLLLFGYKYHLTNRSGIFILLSLGIALHV